MDDVDDDDDTAPEVEDDRNSFLDTVADNVLLSIIVSSSPHSDEVILRIEADDFRQLFTMFGYLLL